MTRNAEASAFLLEPEEDISVNGYTAKNALTLIKIMAQCRIAIIKVKIPAGGTRMKSRAGSLEEFPDQRYDHENSDTCENYGIGPLLGMGNFEYQFFYHPVFV